MVKYTIIYIYVPLIKKQVANRIYFKKCNGENNHWRNKKFTELILKSMSYDVLSLPQKKYLADKRSSNMNNNYEILYPRSIISNKMNEV